MFKRAMVGLKSSRRTAHRGISIRGRWRIYRRGASRRRSARLVRTGFSSTVGHSVLRAAGTALRSASSRSYRLGRRHLDRARRIQLGAAKRVARHQSQPTIDPGLTRGERGTLDVGSAVVLGALGLGVQFGRWPAWTALIAVGGYLTWVVMYSEATVQARRWRSANRTWPLPRTRSEKTAPAPAQE
jgi:hypothetical protein